MCKHTKIIYKRYQYGVFDFHCAECGAWILPDDTVRRWNATRVLSAEDARIASRVLLKEDDLYYQEAVALREYASILGGEDETE